MIIEPATRPRTSHPGGADRGSWNCRVTSRTAIWLLVAVLVLTLAGCGGGSAVGLTTSPGSPSARDQVISKYYSPQQVADFQDDSANIRPNFNGLNVFSTSMYGQSMVRGLVNIKDVYDARIPGNEQIFLQYANQHHYVLPYTPDQQQYIYRYALAATRFLRDFEYDVVLFHPDEFQPVLTSENDTWMFVRDDYSAAVPGQRYYSSRVQSRSLAVQGGFMLSNPPMTFCPEVGLFAYYIPAPGKDHTYTHYVYSVNQPVSGYTGDPAQLSTYVPADASAQVLAQRSALGIRESNLSDEANVPVSTWVTADFPPVLVTTWTVTKGYSYKATDQSNTWGGYGFYVLPLDPEFWR